MDNINEEVPASPSLRSRLTSIAIVLLLFSTLTVLVVTILVVSLPVVSWLIYTLVTEYNANASLTLIIGLIVIAFVVFSPVLLGAYALGKSPGVKREINNAFGLHGV